jgi:hypothetical protein
MTTIITRISQLLQAMENCERSNNTKWLSIWSDELYRIEREVLPRGSGFDLGTQIAKDECRKNRIVLNTSFHHMDEHGSYDGSSSHHIIVTPAFDGFDIKVDGANRNQIKDYIGEIFHDVLAQPYVKPEAGEKDA